MTVHITSLVIIVLIVTHSLAFAWGARWQSMRTRARLRGLELRRREQILRGRS